MDLMTRLFLFMHLMLNPRDTRITEMLNIKMAFPLLIAILKVLPFC